MNSRIITLTQGKEALVFGVWVVNENSKTIYIRVQKRSFKVSDRPPAAYKTGTAVCEPYRPGSVAKRECEPARGEIASNKLILKTVLKALKEI